MAAPGMLDAVRADLTRHSPFDRIPDEELDELLAGVRVRYLDADEVVFEQGDEAADHFYVVKKGCVEIRRGEADGGALVDLSDDGDIFGIRALISHSAYSASARAREDSLVYEVPWDHFEGLMDRCPPVALYLAAGFAAELPRMREQLMAATQDLQRTWTAPAWADDPEGVVRPVQNVLTCGPKTSARDIAADMKERSVGSVIVVDEAHHPVGIVTDTDLRNEVLAGGLDPCTTEAHAIMSAPVKTVKAPQTVAALMGQVMETGLHHFCFTEDGTPNSPVVGIASEHDLITAHAKHPSVLRQKIARSRDPDDLRVQRDRVETMLQTSLEHGLDMRYLCTVMAGVQDALIRSAIRIAEKALASEGQLVPGVPYCWLSFGSEGRREQLLRTDLDQAIVYADPPPEEAQAAKAYFVALGTRVTDVLVHAGYERCPGGIMASNPELTGPLSDWRARFAKWIRAPEPKALMLATIFFDLRPVHGDETLSDALVEHIFEVMKSEPAFVPFFAKNALLNPSPLSFFRNFVVERSGQNSDRFDIKARAMMPLCDAARVLVLELGLDPRGDTTASRFRRIGEALPARAALAEEAAMAYEILMRVRALEGLRTKSSGRYVDISRLNKLERRTLRNTFAVIEDVQRMLSSRFRLDMMR